MRSNRHFIVIILVFLAAGIVSGCATITDAWKGILGISTTGLEKERKGAKKRIFDYDYETAFEKTKEAIGSIDHASIYDEDIKKHVIAFYYIDINTNTVGVFFKEINPGRTQVEVVAGSKDVKQFISDKIFSKLESKQQ